MVYVGHHLDGHNVKIYIAYLPKTPNEYNGTSKPEVSLWILHVARIHMVVVYTLIDNFNTQIS